MFIENRRGRKYEVVSSEINLYIFGKNILYKALCFALYKALKQILTLSNFWLQMNLNIEYRTRNNECRRIGELHHSTFLVRYSYFNTPLNGSDTPEIFLTLLFRLVRVMSIWNYCNGMSSSMAPVIFGIKTRRQNIFNTTQQEKPPWQSKRHRKVCLT